MFIRVGVTVLLTAPVPGGKAQMCRLLYFGINAQTESVRFCVEWVEIQDNVFLVYSRSEAASSK